MQAPTRDTRTARGQGCTELRWREREDNIRGRENRRLFGMVAVAAVAAAACGEVGCRCSVAAANANKRRSPPAVQRKKAAGTKSR